MPSAAGHLFFFFLAGELSSDDDFYLLSTGLAVLQTTNNVFNKTLLKQLTVEVGGCLTRG